MQPQQRTRGSVLLRERAAIRRTHLEAPQGRTPGTAFLELAASLLAAAGCQPARSAQYRTPSRACPAAVGLRSRRACCLTGNVVCLERAPFADNAGALACCWTCILMRFSLERSPSYCAHMQQQQEGAESQKQALDDVKGFAHPECTPVSRYPFDARVRACCQRACVPAHRGRTAQERGKTAAEHKRCHAESLLMRAGMEASMSKLPLMSSQPSSPACRCPSGPLPLQALLAACRAHGTPHATRRESRGGRSCALGIRSWQKRGKAVLVVGACHRKEAHRNQSQKGPCAMPAAPSSPLVSLMTPQAARPGSAGCVVASAILSASITRPHICARSLGGAA